MIDPKKIAGTTITELINNFTVNFDCEIVKYRSGNIHVEIANIMKIVPVKYVGKYLRINVDSNVCAINVIDMMNNPDLLICFILIIPMMNGNASIVISATLDNAFMPRS